MSRAMSLSIARAGSAAALSRAVKYTVACARSRVTSTSDTLISGSRASRTASWTSRPTSRRSSAPTRSVRLKEERAMAACRRRVCRHRPADRRESQRTLNFDALEALDLVADLDVVALHADAALHAGTHLF